MASYYAASVRVASYLVVLGLWVLLKKSSVYPDFIGFPYAFFRFNKF